MGLFHNNCATSELSGYSKTTSCYHLMLGAEPNPVAYIYTKNEDYCCKAEVASSRMRFPPGPSGGGGMTAPQADFMDTMNYVGTGSYSGHYYKGSVKKYRRARFAEGCRYFRVARVQRDVIPSHHSYRRDICCSRRVQDHDVHVRIPKLRSARAQQDTIPCSSFFCLCESCRLTIVS